MVVWMIGIVVGTRPEFMKMAPVIRRLQKLGIPFKLIHTGQHYDYNMSKVFFDELELPEPDEFLEVGSKPRAVQLKLIEEKLCEALRSRSGKKGRNGETITTVCVQGDTNSVLGAARAAKKSGRMLAHVESGARSFDQRMPEEKNRVETDGLSDLLFAPTRNCVRNLKREGITKNVFLSGNTELETLEFSLRKKRPPSFARERWLPKKFALLTLHRQNNATPAKLKQLWNLVKAVGMPVLFLVHPRTQRVLAESGLLKTMPQNLFVEEPVGYFELLWLLEKSSLVLTDSGGLQVEAVALKKPLLILRSETEWMEAVESKAGALVGLDGKSVSKAKKFLASVKPRPGVFKGGAAKLIVSKLMEFDSRKCGDGKR